MKNKSLFPIVLLVSVLAAGARSAGAAVEQVSYGQLGEINRDIPELPAITLPGVVSAVAAPVNSGRDLTEKFKFNMAAANLALSDGEKADLRKYKVLLVPGFLSNIVTKPVNILGLHLNIGKCFGDQMKVLKELGIDYKLVEVESEEIPEYNSAAIAREIEASDKPVIIMCHSKGGLDTLETLIHRRSLLPKVRGIITIQTPYFGSPIADAILKDPVLRKKAAGILKSLGGTLESLISLATAPREAYYREHLPAINEIVATVPMLSFGSWKDEESGKIDTILEPLRDSMLKMGFKNDGQVPIDSSALPGTDHIQVEGADHFVTVMSTGKVLVFDRVTFTKTLLLMLMRP